MMPKEAQRRRGAVGAALAIVAVVLVALVAIGGGLLPSSPVATSAAVIPGSSSSLPAAAPTATHPSPSASPSASPPAPTPSPTAQPSPIPADRLQATLDRLRAKLGIPGASVAIVWDDGRQWLGASGLRNVAAKDPMTTDTGFALASISKTFTAAVVLQLVEEGRLRLDQPVAPLLPSFGLDRRITVRMLLDHTSGLPDFFFGKGIDAALQARPNATWTVARSWSFVPAKHGVPGRTWFYSNTNYLLLGELVRAVTGNPIAVEIRRRLLDPLALGTAWYQAVETPRATGTLAYRLVAKPGGGVRPVLVARASDVMPFRSVVTAAGGAGSMAATALDTARWMQAFAGGRVLSPGMQLTMLADVAATVKLKARIPYGLGIQDVTVNGYPALGHSGRYLGIRNVVRYLPTQGVTIAVLTNQSVVDPNRIATALLALVVPPAPTPSASASPGPSGSASPGPSGSVSPEPSGPVSPAPTVTTAP